MITLFLLILKMLSKCMILLGIRSLDKSLATSFQMSICLWRPFSPKEDSKEWSRLQTFKIFQELNQQLSTKWLPDVIPERKILPLPEDLVWLTKKEHLLLLKVSKHPLVVKIHQILQLSRNLTQMTQISTRWLQTAQASSYHRYWQWARCCSISCMPRIWTKSINSQLSLMTLR